MHRQPCTASGLAAPPCCHCCCCYTAASLCRLGEAGWSGLPLMSGLRHHQPRLDAKPRRSGVSGGGAIEAAGAGTPCPATENARSIIRQARKAPSHAPQAVPRAVSQAVEALQQRLLLLQSSLHPPTNSRTCANRGIRRQCHFSWFAAAPAAPLPDRGKLIGSKIGDNAAQCLGAMHDRKESAAGPPRCLLRSMLVAPLPAHVTDRMLTQPCLVGCSAASTAKHAPSLSCRWIVSYHGGPSGHDPTGRKKAV